MFLLCNAVNRDETIKSLPKFDFSIKKKSIKKYELSELDSKRLDKIYNLSMIFFDKNDSKNPKDML